MTIATASSSRAWRSGTRSAMRPRRPIAASRRARSASEAARPDSTSARSCSMRRRSPSARRSSLVRRWTMAPTTTSVTTGMSQWSTSTPRSGSWSTTSWTPISRAAANTPWTTAWRSPNTNAYGVAQRKRYAKPLPFAPLTKQRPATRTVERASRPFSTAAGASSATPRTSRTPRAWARTQIASSAGTCAGRSVLEREPDLGHRGRADVEPPERTGHAAPVGRWAHGGFGDRQRNRFPRRLLRHPAGFLERGRTIRDVCPGGQTAKSAALKAVRSKGHCGFDSRPGYSRPGLGPAPVPARAAGRVGPQGPAALRPRSGRVLRPVRPTARCGPDQRPLVTWTARGAS